jgi:hypothetical protein
MKKNKSITGIFLVKSSNQNFYYNVIDRESLIEQGIISEENLKNLYQNLPRYYLNENDFDAENLIRHKFLNNEFADVFKIEPYYIAEGVLLKN